MMKLAITALLAGSAAAFAPAASKSSTTALSVGEYADELGTIAPTGFWDPLRLSSGIDQEKFDKYRAAELKHGRVAQLAVIGYVAPEIWRWGGDISPGIPYADIPNGLDAIDAVPFLGWVQIIAAVGIVDTKGYLGDFAAGKPDLEPEELAKRQLQELQHGRLAMLAFAELVRHDAADYGDNLITGLPFLY
mmetsp:Transcript_22120/g.29106  ORF Transcript_22120/g.29106 Transcript_22120/m.29106 type:complete len:191 (-) Transcript_22120:73-645(-)|eukprot:CAMPEP_0195254104 /NCGR_PEP_ID=MMETSP0706-20130129/4865_1 /TAXON_ID=33640 /ORGANISM="Asterionellopsis glacialis, Strain CCMP134" /LENGTH=190 /DNA_ID=CAMNT_0040306739 /DNA_START=25 /DNA_END=597 /DNA_ORIENTATION=+